MPNVTIYLPKALVEQLQRLDTLNVSAVCQEALQQAVDTYVPPVRCPICNAILPEGVET